MWRTLFFCSVGCCRTGRTRRPRRPRRTGPLFFILSHRNILF
nr:MAG TPA: hypothetical protein [Caudoviricetes sp.]